MRKTLTGLCALLVGAASVGGCGGGQPSARGGSGPATCASDAAAPASVLGEVKRLLQSGGEHATHSSNCVDGGGHRVSVAEVAASLVERDGSTIWVEASYLVTDQPGAATRGCG